MDIIVDVAGITHISPGNNCIEIDPTLTRTVITITMDVADDGTSLSSVAWAEVAGTCGTHGINVVTLRKLDSPSTATFLDAGFYFTMA